MKTKTVLSVLILILLSTHLGIAVSITEKTSEMEKYTGYFPFYWDEAGGKIWLEIDKVDTEFLYVHSLPAGLGSNDIGLDRNQLGRTRIVKFKRVGPKVLLIQPNYGYRATSDNPKERKAVKDAFAQSVIWGFNVEAEGDGVVLIDLTPFLMRDAHGVTARIKRSRQGDFKLDQSRSAIYMENSKNFPLNTEFESLLTFTGQNPGNYVRQVAPDPQSITVRQHHSFIQLPDDDYEPRVYDHRSMYGGRSGYLDFATPIDEPIRKRFINRHRLEKKDPNAAVSEAVEPIVYYIDNGVPEPIRTALVEGAQWWNDAFEAIGYKDAFRAEVLPDSADPMDIRYNMINWVHRSTRGWSYGSSVSDPRTGEIIKGHVALGSQRLRQDYLIATGLVGDYQGKSGETKDMVEMALARIRQLSCHEVGHTLGVGHNYASSVNDRSSVMDYPHPRILIDDDGTLDLSQAYDTGVGEWDIVCVNYGYQDFPDGTDEVKALRKILDDAFESGLYYLTNQDAAPAGGASPLSNDWDNGIHAVDELIHKMKVRQIALENFSESKIRIGEAMCTLEEVLVPTYLFHRYQIEAAASFVGGLNYHHTVRSGSQKPPTLVPGDEQRRALNVLLQTIEPDNLEIPESIMEIMPPRAPGYSQHRELFPGKTGITFDPLGAAETVAQLTVGFLLYPERASRLVEYHARDNSLPSLNEVIETLISATIQSPAKQGMYGEIKRVVNHVVLEKMMALAVDERASHQARAIVFQKLDDVKQWLAKRMKKEKDLNQKAHYRYAHYRIVQFQKEPDDFKLAEPLRPPPGAPIG